ncbi:MAG: serine/threonine protein kinase [Pirellulaceae bacterium]|nr:serine/threonine protein kinase [Pirellulaceae bacterium]
MAGGRDYLGSYRLVRLIRTGATCQVWEAVRDHERVAIKFLQPEVRNDKLEIGYLRHESEVGRRLHHPNVIEIHTFHIDRSIAFLVMEYHPGKNVKMLIRQGFDSFGYLVPKIIEQAALGLQYLHQQGWVHRDIKPDNFLVTDNGDVKLIDFALAWRIPTGLARLFARRTRVQGTRSYMAPEQIRGRALDGRTDVYAFGCMIYELLTGRLPFTGISPEDLLRKHLTGAIPAVMSGNRNVTPDFNDLVSQMMAKEPAERPASMEEFLRYFHAVRVFRSLPKPPSEQSAGAYP